MRTHDVIVVRQGGVLPEVLGPAELCDTRHLLLDHVVLGTSPLDELVRGQILCNHSLSHTKKTIAIFEPCAGSV